MPIENFAQTTHRTPPPEKTETEKERIKTLLDEFFSEPGSPGRLRTVSETVTIPRDRIEELIETGSTLESVLRVAMLRGYLFHGSPTDVQELEPKTPSPAEGSPEEEFHTGIFSTNFPPIAIFCAIKSGQRAYEKFGTERLHTEWHVQGEDERTAACRFVASQEIIDTLSEGWIYVLRAEDFTVLGEDFFRSEKYCPPIRVRVKPSDLIHEVLPFNGELSK